MKLSRHEYQLQTIVNLSKVSIAKTLPALTEVSQLLAFQDLLRHTEANHKQLDFINKKLTTYNMRYL